MELVTVDRFSGFLQAHKEIMKKREETFSQVLQVKLNLNEKVDSQQQFVEDCGRCRGRVRGRGHALFQGNHGRGKGGKIFPNDEEKHFRQQNLRRRDRGSRFQRGHGHSRNMISD